MTDSWSPRYRGLYTFNYSITNNTSFSTHSGIEFVAGLNYSSRTAKGSSYEIGLTAEYATFSGPTIDYQICLMNSANQKEYAVNERAKLLYIKLSFVYYFRLKGKKV